MEQLQSVAKASPMSYEHKEALGQPKAKQQPREALGSQQKTGYAQHKPTRRPQA